MKFIYICIALTFLILLTISGCHTRSDELNALLKNLISTNRLTMGHEVSSWYQDKGVALGKPVQASARIEYAPINNHTQEALYNEIIDVFDRNGWEKAEQSLVKTGYFRAALPQDDFLLVVEVLMDSQSNLVSVQLEANRN